MRKKNLDSLILDEKVSLMKMMIIIFEESMVFETEEETYSKPRPIEEEMKSLDYEDEIVRV